MNDEPGKWPSAAVALLLMLAMFAALSYGLEWRTRPPPIAGAVLWMEAVTPPPQPEPAAQPSSPPSQAQETVAKLRRETQAAISRRQHEAQRQKTQAEVARRQAAEQKRREAQIAEEAARKIADERRREAAQTEAAEEARRRREAEAEKKRRAAELAEERRVKAEREIHRRAAEESQQREAAKVKAARRQAERDARRKAEQDARRQAEQDARRRAEEQAAEEARLAALRADLREKYISRIGRRIERNLRTPPGTAADAEVRMVVRLYSSGELAADPQVAQGSGFPDYDEEAVRAVLKSAPLPMPRDDATLLAEFSVLTLNIRPPR